MVRNEHKLALGGLGGISIAILVIASFAWLGYLPSAQATGMLVVKVKDAPSELEEVWLKIDEAKVHRKGGGNTTWYEVSVLQEDPFDLLSLTNFSIVLAVQELLVGNYTEIRLHVTDANATINGTSIPLNIATEWMKIKAHFEIQEGKATTITIDMNVNEEPIIKANLLMPVAVADVSVEYDE